MVGISNGSAGVEAAMNRIYPAGRTALLDAIYVGMGKSNVATTVAKQLF